VLSSGEMTEGSGEEPHKIRGEQGARLAVQGKPWTAFYFRNFLLAPPLHPNLADELSP